MNYLEGSKRFLSIFYTNEKNKENLFEQIPTEIVIKIFELLDSNTKLTSRLVCRDWGRILYEKGANLFEFLPEEILLNIFYFLDPKTKISLSLP